VTRTPATPAAALLEDLRGRRPEMLDWLETLVNLESPSSDPALLETALDGVGSLLARLVGDGGRRVRSGDTGHLVWESGRPRVLILCHVDTVWPRGTLDRWPFRADGERATGPGVVDMKAGIVQAVFAISALGAPPGVRLVVTTDEEVGSPGSRSLIEASAAGLEAALVLEAAHEGALKVARKGAAQYTVCITGRAAHASEPARGANAALEMAAQMLAVAALADPRAGPTVTPTLSAAGTTANTVPGSAEFRVDARAASTAELERVATAMRSLRPHLEGTEINVLGGVERNPMPAGISRGLFERARTLASSLGLPPLQGVLAPGASDGQFTAAMGIPTLDGLGAVGGNAHAEGEWVEVERMPERAALLAALLQDVLNGAGPEPSR
jgi:glutamate carboxypeptidase